MNISQLLHRKGQTHAPLDTDERSLAIGRYYDAPLNAMMLYPHVYPAIGQRGEIDNDCLYTHHLSRRLDLQSPLALRLVTNEHSPNIIDNLNITGVHSTDSATTSAFMIQPLRLTSKRHHQHNRRSTRGHAQARNTYLLITNPHHNDSRLLHEHT